MPVRSLNSAVFRWPGPEAVLSAARCWAVGLQRRDPSVQRVICIGSYARGDWGVGSDLDLIVVLQESALSRAERYAAYYPDDLPVPCDLWVYTEADWDALGSRAPHLWRRIQREMMDLL